MTRLAQQLFALDAVREFFCLLPQPCRLGGQSNFQGLGLLHAASEHRATRFLIDGSGAVVVITENCHSSLAEFNAARAGNVA